jgi:hypothetical protein
MEPALITDSNSDKTVWFIASRQCVEAAGVGARTSDNGKQMILTAIG